jgi:thiol:disulfide interchange protein DsbD
MHRRLLSLLGGACALLLATTAAASDFLTPDQAFRISAKAAGPDRVDVTWRIADGYYLYRSKFRVQSDTPGVEPGPPELPASETKDDEFFGRVDIYRGEVTLGVPLRAGEAIPDVVTLRTLSQGCADAGLCYPPHQQTVLVAMTPAADQPRPMAAAPAAPQPAPTAESAIPALTRPAPGLGKSLGLDGGDDLLPAEEAFRFSASVIDGERLRLAWQIAPGTYLYQDKVKATIEGGGASLLPLLLPPPKI